MGFVKIREKGMEFEEERSGEGKGARGGYGAS